LKLACVNSRGGTNSCKSSVVLTEGVRLTNDA
jgi:hypothetical protein